MNDTLTVWKLTSAQSSTVWMNLWGYISLWCLTQVILLSLVGRVNVKLAIVLWIRLD